MIKKRKRLLIYRQRLTILFLLIVVGVGMPILNKRGMKFSFLFCLITTLLQTKDDEGGGNPGDKAEYLRAYRADETAIAKYDQEDTKSNYRVLTDGEKVMIHYGILLIS